MTFDVLNSLEQIKNLAIFEDEIYFVGGTALSYYINHRISEDIDIVSSKILDYKSIISNMTKIGAKKIVDENSLALRLAGLFPDEYILKFIFNDVKIEFFYANHFIQKEILKIASFKTFENSKLKILSLKDISKLKIVAFLQRDKTRDLFDFGSILENKIVSFDEILYIAKEIKNINSKKDLIKFVLNKKEPKDDEAVYLSEKNRLNLSFDEIKKQVLDKLADPY